MRIPVDDQFLSDLRTFALRYRCDDCLYFACATVSCAHLWPTEDHRTLPQPSTEVVFCKEFEVS